MSSNEGIPPGLRWRVTIDDAQFEKLKSDPAFWNLVALSRVVNALRFVHDGGEHFQDNSPESIRFRYGSFLFSCSLIYEASLRINTLGKYFGHMPEYRAMVSPINARDAQELIHGNLGPVRNSVAFHFGPDDIGTQLQRFRVKDVTFVAGLGPKNRQVHYELADLCAMNIFTAETFQNPGDLWKLVLPLVRKTSELSLGFIENAEKFIAKVLEDTGWRVVWVPMADEPRTS